jgi:hypothetical protein
VVQTASKVTAFSDARGVLSAAAEVPMAATVVTRSAWRILCKGSTGYGY